MSSVTSHANTITAPALPTKAFMRKDPWRAVRTVARYAVLVIVLVICLLPIFWVIATSIKLPGEYLRNPPVWIPQDPTLIHYQNVMVQRGNAALKNSVIIASGATLFSMLVGSFAAYSLARLQTGGKHFAFWLLSQRMMPPVVLIVPFFLLLRELGQINPALGLDSHIALIALYTVGVFTSFTLSQVGMLRHWRRHLASETDPIARRRMRRSQAINGFGAAMTGVVLVIVLITKFTRGAWIAIVAMGR